MTDDRHQAQRSADQAHGVRILAAQVCAPVPAAQTRKRSTRPSRRQSRCRPTPCPPGRAANSVSLAPKTLCATATGKYSHMQKRPSQVQSCTGPSLRMVSGISAIARRRSRARCRPGRSSAPSRAGRLSMSSGGYSLVVTMVHSTAPRKGRGSNVEREAHGRWDGARVAASC